MKKRIVSALLAGFLLVSATACGKQPAADAAQPVADPTQAYLDTVDVDYAYDLALKLEDIRSNETLGYRTAGSDAELATGDMLKAEMERIGLQNVTKDAFTLDTQDSLFGLSRRCILLGFPAHTLHPQGVCSIRKAAEPLTAALPYRCGESTSLSTASPLIVSKKSFLPAVPHKERPAALRLLAVIYILSPSFGGERVHSERVPPPCCLPFVTRCRPDNPRQTAPSARFPWEAETR